jgi:hypothetical protein
VTEAVCGPLEFYGDERGRRCEDPPTAPQDIVNHRLADEERQKLVHDHPLVMPGRELARLAKDFLGRASTVSADEVHSLVVGTGSRPPGGRR